MKKSLVTLALLGAFAPAFAENVSVYGLIDAGIENTSVAGKSTTGLTSGAGWGSRIGFKGTEDLGGGLSVKFALEQGFNVDKGTEMVSGSQFARQAWIGVASAKLGEVRVGRQHTLILDQTAGFDPFQIGLAGNAVKFLQYGYYNTNARLNDAVTYISPTVGGFEGRVQYGFGETTDSFGSNSTLGLNGTYNNGPLSVSLTHNQRKFNAVGVDEKLTDVLLGGTYDFQVAKAHFAYGQSKVEDNLASTTDKLTNYLVGVSAPVAGGTVMASYLRSDIKDLDNSTSSQYAVGYTYPLSKRTKLYTSYAHVTNESNANLISNVDGASANKFNVGVSHAF